MKKTSSSKTLQDKITESTKGITCPVHGKLPLIKVDKANERVEVECCCNSFKTDIEVITNRVLAAWKLHGEHLRARKDGRDY